MATPTFPLNINLCIIHNMVNFWCTCSDVVTDDVESDDEEDEEPEVRNLSKWKK